MDVAELVEIALANSGGHRVEVAALEPAVMATEAISGLAQLISELVDNAIAFSQPEEEVRLTGLFDQDDYLLTISDRGVGLSEDLRDELNRALDDPESGSGPGPDPRMGIALVARLARRHEIGVRLVPGVPGTTARVVVPGRLVTRPVDAPSPRPADHRLPARPQYVPSSHEPISVASNGTGLEPETNDLTRFDRRPAHGTGVVAMSESAKLEAETFLERVFAPLVNRPGMTERPAPKGPVSGNGTVRRPEARPDQSAPRQPIGTVTALRVRVPGENYAHVDDDQSILAAEKAIDIRSALSRYEQGRRRAQEGDS
jgi:anti-sigma regulatory factor (Ser/Thr protein kinase)